MDETKMMAHIVVRSHGDPSSVPRADLGGHGGFTSMVLLAVFVR